MVGKHQQLIQKYPSLANGDPAFRTSGHVHLGRRIIYARATANTRRLRSGKGTIIGFLSESDVDSSNNAAYVATKSTKYAKKGEPAKLFHIALDERDNDNDIVVLDLEEWELDEYCEWIAINDEGTNKEKKAKKPSHLCRKEGCNKHRQSNCDGYCVKHYQQMGDIEETMKESDISEEKKKKQKARKIHAQPNCNDDKSNAKTEFEKLDNLAQEAAASATLRRNDNPPPVKAANNSVDNQLICDKDKWNCMKCGTTNESSKKRCGKCMGWKFGKVIPKESYSTDTQSRKKATSHGGNSEKKRQGKTDQTESCPSFNDILKSALSSYSSSLPKRGTHKPPLPPLPPPFLSHEENCTLRTALAFVIARARNKEKTSLSQAKTLPAFENTDMLGADPTFNNGMSSQVSSPLVGGLLGLPPRDCVPIGQLDLNGSNSKIELDRELKHVRDVMNLALSALLPLYKNILHEKNVNGGQRQSAVYDYESAAKASSLPGSQIQLSSSERHLATLDGLCQHIIGRISSILNDKALRRKLKNESLSMINAGTSQDENTKCSTNIEESTSERHNGKNDVVRDAVAQVLLDFITGALCQSSDATEQTQQIMAACHVLHRLLLLDENCSTIGSDCVAMVCTILTDLYNDKCIIGRNEGGANNKSRHLDDPDSRQVGQEDKGGKHQVVPSRWSYPPSCYNTHRQERHKEALYAMSQCYNPTGAPITGMKRSATTQSHDESTSSPPIQRLRLGDVLAVNLLRLLEGASAIRLHFRQRYAGQQCGNGYGASRTATSTAAREVLQEVRSKMDHQLLLPIHMNDAAVVYLENLNSQHQRSGKVGDHFLRPGAKMMLRIHLFGLLQKLSMYEQAGK
ncbi:hypothetical protein ACHAWC_007146 [Mediolabrus comicus]